MARRLGTAGYYVILPNLYYRRTREFNIFGDDPTQTREVMSGKPTWTRSAPMPESSGIRGRSTASLPDP